MNPKNYRITQEFQSLKKTNDKCETYPDYDHGHLCASECYEKLYYY